MFLSYCLCVAFTIPCFIKKEPLVIDYNSRIFGRSIFVIFVPFETGMNTLPSRHKQCHFNLSASPLYLVKLKTAQKRPTVYCNAFCLSLNRLFQTFAESRSIFVFFLYIRKFFSSLLTENILRSGGFYQNSIWLVLACKLKLNCRDFRRVSYDVIKQLSK